MAGNMSMNTVIHDAVRRDLKRLATALASATDGDKARAGDLQRAYANLHTQLTHHHEQEDALIFPALSRLGVDLTLIGEMEDEHHAMSDALGMSAVAMQQYAATGSAADASTAHTSVEDTHAVVERHLAHEEAELEPLMRGHLETEEWKAVDKSLRKMPPKQAGQFFAWLTDGMTPEDQEYLGSTIPRPVLVMLSRGFGRKYHREIAPVWQSA